MSRFAPPVEPESFALPAGPVVTDAMVDEMNRDLADVIRNNEALTEAELELLAQQADRDAAGALAASIAAVNAAKAAPTVGETSVAVHGKRFRASARVAGGRWMNAGTFATEPAAWVAARELLARMVEAHAA